MQVKIGNSIANFWLPPRKYLETGVVHQNLSAGLISLMNFFLSPAKKVSFVYFVIDTVQVSTCRPPFSHRNANFITGPRSSGTRRNISIIIPCPLCVGIIIAMTKSERR
jgi:hypothetical protein